MDTTQEVDYVYWSKWDEWSFKDAALLLHGFEPLNYTQVRFNVSNPPAETELKDAHKTFLILRRANWQELGLITRDSAHPYDIQEIARQKDLTIPEQLNTCLDARRKQEKEYMQRSSPSINTTTEATSNIHETNNETSAHVRERRNLLKIIGILALIISDDPKQSSKFKFKGNDRLNASQIKEIVMAKAEQLNIEADGIRSLDRKIPEALGMLDEKGWV